MPPVLYRSMAAPQPRERLRVSPRSAVVAVALFGAVLTGLRIMAASQRVLGWVIAAAAVAGLLHPYVNVLSRRLPRGLAVVIVALLTVGSAATIAYALVDGVVREYHEIQRAAPERAKELEQRGRFREAFADAHLSQRVQVIVDEAPLRLQGGTAADAIRSAATRGIAFLATGVLALFFMLHGPKMAEAAARQVHTRSRRKRVERVAMAAFRRGFGYARGTLAMAMLAGLLAWAVGSAADVPGPAPLALWVALWDVVPVIGAVVGAVPIVALAAIAEPSRGILLAVVFIAYQLVEWLVLQRWIERRTVHIGPFVTVVVGFAGLELYGVGGALVTLLATVLGAAALDELAPPEDDHAAVAAAGAGASAAPADGGQVGPVGVVEVDGGRPAQDLAHEV
jgi:predicted PurR-regulated permease PerM